MANKPLTITVLVKTKAKQSTLEWDKDNECFIAHVKSQPIKGRANNELMKMIKNYFDAQSIVLIKGATSTTKIFSVEGAMKNVSI